MGQVCSNLCPPQNQPDMVSEKPNPSRGSQPGEIRDPMVGPTGTAAVGDGAGHGGGARSQPNTKIPKPHPDVPLATTFGLPDKFTTVKVLGAGGEGHTYLMAEEMEDGHIELYAVKIVTRSPKLRKKFLLGEIRNQCCLNHVNIVKILEAILTPTHLAIKMEYVSGGTFLKFLSEHEAVSKYQLLSEEDARYYFHQLVDAIKYCHQHRVAHRDIKMANILLCDKAGHRIKICDFGLSTAYSGQADPMQRSRSAVGTPEYMSPEVLKIIEKKEQPQRYDPEETDVWALGVLLFVMNMGRFPFDVKNRDMAGVTGALRTIEAAHMAHNRGHLALDLWGKAQITTQCRDLIDRMLDMDADQRITMDEVMQHPWYTKPMTQKHEAAMEAMHHEMDMARRVSVNLNANTLVDPMLENIIKLAASGPASTIHEHNQQHEAAVMRWQSWSMRVIQRRHQSRAATTDSVAKPPVDSASQVPMATDGVVMVKEAAKDGVERTPLLLDTTQDPRTGRQPPSDSPQHHASPNGKVASGKLPSPFAAPPFQEEFTPDSMG